MQTRVDLGQAGLMAAFQLQGWLQHSILGTFYFSDLQMMGKEFTDFLKLHSSLHGQTQALTSNNLEVQLSKAAPWGQGNPL